MYRFAPVAAWFVALGSLAHAQTVDFELRTYPLCPIVFAGGSARTPAPGVPARQFVTIQNGSKRTAAAVTFQQTVSQGSKTGIVAIERVAIVIPPGEKRRVSMAVADMSGRLESARQSGESPGRPVLSVVAVEFLDGTGWNAPTGTGAAAAKE
jgi:hypothetical protein